MGIDVPATLERLLAGRDLEAREVQETFQAIMAGEVAPEQTAGLLVALRAKGETADEVAGAARAMRLAATPAVAPAGAIDMCGTGGDGKHTVNISTAAALVVAAGGIVVAKHGNRSVSSKSGSADVLAELGIPVDLDAAGVEKALASVGFAFLFAPHFHPAMKHAIGPRRALGIRTIFNLLGPLTNPAGVKRQVIGVFDRQWVEPVAQVLKLLGCERGLVVHSRDGMDELSLDVPTDFAELRDGEIVTGAFDPRDLGLPRHGIETIRGGDACDNAAAILRAFEGQAPALADWIVLNAAAGIRVARDLDWREAVDAARETLASGRARAYVDRLRAAKGTN